MHRSRLLIESTMPYGDLFLNKTITLLRIHPSTAACGIFGILPCLDSSYKSPDARELTDQSRASSKIQSFSNTTTKIMATQVCVIGPTGVGKSALCNLMCGKGDGARAAFPVSESINACTYMTTAQTERWFGTEETFTLIDTPGLGDPEGRDTQHISNMVSELKDHGHVNAFLVVFNSQNPRMDEHLRAMLDIFAKIFSNDFLLNVVMVFTRWEHNKKAERRRQRTGESRANREREFNGYFKQHFGIKHTLPAVFVDNYPDREDPEEYEATMAELVALQDYAQTLPPFQCEDAQAVRGHIDELQNNIEDERQQRLAAVADALAKAEEVEREKGLREEQRTQHEAELTQQQDQFDQQMQDIKTQMEDDQKRFEKKQEEMMARQRELIRKIKKKKGGFSIGPVHFQF